MTNHCAGRWRLHRQEGSIPSLGKQVHGTGRRRQPKGSTQHVALPDVVWLDGLIRCHTLNPEVDC